MRITETKKKHDTNRFDTEYAVHYALCFGSS